MRVPPNGFRPVGHTSPSISARNQEITKEKFSTTLSSTTRSDKADLPRAADIMDDVKSIATQLRSGQITKEDASRKFVSLVIEKRHDLSRFGAKSKQIEEAVSEIAGDDPNFLASLINQLQKLS